MAHHSGFGLDLGSAFGAGCCAGFSVGGGLAGFRVSRFAAGGCAAGSDG
jgi:hypothetical protein